MKSFILVFLTFFIFQISSGQHSYYYHKLFHKDLAYFNPAYTAIKDSISVFYFSKAQAFKMYSVNWFYGYFGRLAVDIPVKSISSGVRFYGSYENMNNGEKYNYGTSLRFTHTFSNDFSVHLGTNLYYHKFKVPTDELMFCDPEVCDELTSKSFIQTQHFVLGVGLLFKYKKAGFGIASPGIYQNKYTKDEIFLGYKIPTKINITAHHELTLNNGNTMFNSTCLSFYGYYGRFYFNQLFQLNKFLIGLTEFYKKGKSGLFEMIFAPNIGAKFNNHFNFLFSFTLLQVTNYSYLMYDNALELILKYTF